MPPKKTGTTNKTTARKPAAKKPAAKKTAAKRPASKKPTRRNYKKKQDKKLPIGMLIAVIPAILLFAFIALRFTGGEKPQTVTAPKPQPVPKPQTIIKEVQATSVPDTVKLFLFEKELSHDMLKIKGSGISISADSEKQADSISAALRKYLTEHKIIVDGRDVMTAEDTSRIYNISFSFPKPVEKKEVHTPIPQAAPVKKAAAKQYKAKLAIVIDDCGYSVPLAKSLAKVPYPVTFAVIPYTPYGVETAQIAKKAGHTLFLHFPMQPKSYPDFDPGKGALLLNMPETLIAAVTKANFEFFPMKLDGANNHTGSAFTESREKMQQAFRHMKKYTDTFLDSYTSGGSVAYDTCRSAGMRCGVNNVFLDNEEPGLVTITDKKNHVRDQLVYAANKALKSGSAVAIGHLRNGTVQGLTESLRYIEDRMDVQIVPVKSLM